MRLPPRSAAQPVTAPVQTRSDPAAETARERQAILAELWMDTAMRPDTPREPVPMPVQMHDGGVESGSEVHRLAAEGISGTTTTLPYLDTIQRSFGRHDASNIEAHIGGPATRASEAIGARAYATGNHVAFRQGPDLHTAAHEAAHVIQQRAGVALSGGIGQEGDAYERHADAVADRVVSGRSAEDLLNRYAGGDGQHALQQRTARESALQLHPAEKILKYSAKWLSRRMTWTVSKHIGKHARRIAGKAIHSIFKNPKKIKSMLELTVKEATELAARHASKPATEMLEEGAIRIARQTTGTPGKFRWIVQKTFPDAIGTAGERVLRIVIDQSGRIVSAFPADRLLAIGIGVGALGVLDARTAAASERTRDYAARDAAKEDDVSWWEFVPIIGDLWGGELNAGEDEELRRERELSAEIASTIAAIEDEETRCLTAEEKQVIEDAFRAAAATPLHAEADDEASE